MIEDTTALRGVQGRMEADLDALRRQLGDAEEELTELRASLRRGKITQAVVDRQEGIAVELRREVQRRKIALAELADRMVSAEQDAVQGQLEEALRRNEALKDELDLLRRELLKGLIGLAGLIRKHRALAEEKQHLGGDLAGMTGNDYGYENYISCALLHSKDYRGDVQFVLDTLKKARPVS